jgi:lipoate-protein ligase A
VTSSSPLFDVERFRGEATRVVAAPEVPHPTLVLGSTQPAELPDPDAVRARGVEVVRRRGGGGAVYLEPGDHLWLDAWIPRSDPLWAADVSAAAEWVGAWWLDALDTVGGGGGGGGGAARTAYAVHRGRSVPGEFGELVCFAGRGPGEVFVGERKLVGLSQWRSREGSLFSSCAYLHWDPRRTVELFDLGDPSRGVLAEELTTAAIGLAEIEPALADLGPLCRALVTSFSSFSLPPPGPGASTPAG